MFPYILLVLVPTIVYYIEKRIHSKKNFTIISFFTILVIMLAFRNIKCGVDLINYKYMFDRCATKTFGNINKLYTFNQEKLYYLLNNICSTINNNFQFFLAVVSCICMIPIAIMYKKESKNSLLTIALFITVAPFSMFFSGLRQSIAMAIIVLSFKFIKEKKIIQFILMVIIAYGFHQSAIVAILLYPLYHAKITRKWLVVVIPIMIAIFVFKNHIFTVMLTMNSRYQERYNVITSTGAYSILILLALFCVYCFIFTDKNKENMDFIGLRNLLLLSTCIQCFASINSVVMRINYYTLLFIPILIPKVHEICDSNYKKIIGTMEFVMCVFFICYFFINSNVGNDILNIYPYIGYWE